MDQHPYTFTDPRTPVHLPTEQSREQVRLMAAIGLTTEQIAYLLHCTPSEVTLHYSAEVEHGLVAITAEVAASLVTAARTGDVQAQKYWLEVRAKWKAPATVVPLGALTGDERRALVDSILGVVHVEPVQAAQPQAVVLEQVASVTRLKAPDREQ